jgi:hypothetical protein
MCVHGMYVLPPTTSTTAHAQTAQSSGTHAVRSSHTYALLPTNPTSTCISTAIIQHLRGAVIIHVAAPLEGLAREWSQGVVGVPQAVLPVHGVLLLQAQTSSNVLGLPLRLGVVLQGLKQQGFNRGSTGVQNNRKGVWERGLGVGFRSAASSPAQHQHTRAPIQTRCCPAGFEKQG